MTISEIRTILENRIANLNKIRGIAVLSGDLEHVAKIDIDLMDTQAAIDKLAA